MSRFFSKHTSGLGTASGGGEDHHGFLDAAELFKQFPDGVAFAYPSNKPDVTQFPLMIDALGARHRKLADPGHLILETYRKCHAPEVQE